MTLNLSTSFDSLYRCFDNIVGDEIAFTLSLSTFFFSLILLENTQNVVLSSMMKTTKEL